MPILRSADAAVIGGSLAGVAAALFLSKAGLRAVLVEPRTYLGREITATLRPWLTLDPPGPGPEPPGSDLWRALLERMAIEPAAGEIPLHIDALKRTLEDLLLDAGVEPLYSSLPVAVLGGAEGIEGVVIANKSGRQVIAAPIVVDTTETALVARLAGGRFRSSCSGGSAATARYTRALEFDRAAPLARKTIPVPPALGLADDQVTLHRGYREGHLFATFELDLPPGDDPASSMEREIVARDVSMSLAAFLIANVPAFHQATVGFASFELCGPQTGRLDSPADNPFAGPIPGLWCLNEAAHVPDPAAFRDPAAAAHFGEFAAADIIRTLLRPDSRAGRGVGRVVPLRRPPRQPVSLHQNLRPCFEISLARADQPETEQPAYTHETGSGRSPSDEGQIVPAAWSDSHPHPVEPAPALEVRELESPRPGRPYIRRAVSASEIPVLDETDVLVVGGGTSGATAAITAAREGASTVLLEMNPGLGGTGTIGGVHSYWYGRHTGFAARVQALTDEVHLTIGHTKSTWNIEAKMYALLREAVRAGVTILWNASTFGTVLEGNRVRGAVAATRWGPVVVLADVVIDATGDGDIAAFAGADFVYGAGRDHTTMWYSLAQFTTPGRTRNNFTSSVEISNVEDYTRAILAGRRRGNEVHDHGVYLAPRESRHILGDVVLTHTDQLVMRHWPDVVNVHYSNHDVKGPSTSPWVRMGLIPPNLEIEVPYRALIPRDLEGLIVTGKAISATHDALAAIRMQADMENLGGVAALAAVQSLRERVRPRAIDLPALQRRLLEEGILTEDVLARPDQPPCYSDADLRALVDALDGSQPLYAYSDMEMGEVFTGRIPFVDVCTAGPRIVPFLEEALATAHGLRRIHLAQALAFYGSATAVPVLIEEIERRLQGSRLPARDNQIRHANYPPDQGAMPDIVYLLYSLGMARDRRSLPVFDRVVDLMEPSEEDLRDRRMGTFYYVEAICWGMEHLADPAAIPILRRLHSFPPLRDQVSRRGFQADYFLERQALLELCIARAQARCGDDEGSRTLIAYLEDARSLLAQSAYAHLIALTGQDFGRDAAAWELDPYPLRARRSRPSRVRERARTSPACKALRAETSMRAL